MWFICTLVSNKDSFIQTCIRYLFLFCILWQYWKSENLRHMALFNMHFYLMNHTLYLIHLTCLFYAFFATSLPYPFTYIISPPHISFITIIIAKLLVFLNVLRSKKTQIWLIKKAVKLHFTIAWNSGWVIYISAKGICLRSINTKFEKIYIRPYMPVPKNETYQYCKRYFVFNPDYNDVIKD